MHKLKILSWNVNGIRSLIKKHNNTLTPLFSQWGADIICFQETKISNSSQITQPLAFPDKFQSFWSFAKNKKGYSGVVTYSKKSIPVYDAWEGLGDKELDIEGRCIVTDFGNFVIFNVYVPNGGMGDHRIEFKLKFYQQLKKRMHEFVKKGKHVIVVGDLNTAHKPIDIHCKPELVEDCTGFLPEERAWFDDVLNEKQEIVFVDSFRKFYPDKKGVYSWWDPKTGARQKNKGWRLDYILADTELMKYAKNASVLTTQLGSDHCPVILELEIPLKKEEKELIKTKEYQQVSAEYFSHLKRVELKQIKIFSYWKSTKRTLEQKHESTTKRQKL